MKIIWHWLLLCVALYATTYILPGKISFTPLYIVLFVGAVLFFVNAIIKPIIKLLTLPINLLTLGLFGIILNGLIFWSLTFVIPGFHVAGFGAAVIGALLVSILNWILEKIFK